jgi:hypothetical protein
VNRNRLPAVIACVNAWGQEFVSKATTYTAAARHQIVLDVVGDLAMTDDEARAFMSVALPRAAFASPQTFALRVIQTISEVLN